MYCCYTIIIAFILIIITYYYLSIITILWNDDITHDYIVVSKSRTGTQTWTRTQTASRTATWTKYSLPGYTPCPARPASLQHPKADQSQQWPSTNLKRLLKPFKAMKPSKAWLYAAGLVSRGSSLQIGKKIQSFCQHGSTTSQRTGPHGGDPTCC